MEEKSTVTGTETAPENISGAVPAVSGESGKTPAADSMGPTERMFRTLPPMITEDDLKKLPADFSGTVEIPLTPHQVQQEQAKSGKPQTLDELLPGSNNIPDFEALMWGGNIPDLPVVNYGDDYVVTEGESLPEGAAHASPDDLVKAMQTVVDPEIMLNVYDLGLIYRMDTLVNGDVEIDMTVTAPSCPVAGLMPKQVAEAVAKLEGVGKVTVKLVWEPAWSIDRMSENARYILDMF
ncbi:MAG: iron-sulfur cluster assembly protein [Alphaproteobacteria bacterium]|jgi:FeS assembly SUF system protein